MTEIVCAAEEESLQKAYCGRLFSMPGCLWSHELMAETIAGIFPTSSSLQSGGGVGCRGRIQDEGRC